MIGGQGEDSCGKSGTGETPQERRRRGGSPAARGKRSLARKSTSGVINDPYELISPSLEWNDFVMSESLLLTEYKLRHHLEQRRETTCLFL
ncbi:hypothetical protein ACLHDF_01235 [Priestia aryabhattai]|uniref:hypothetical protein n=1 Tax=Priestia megaterium TaxID=1404 RepID=UPI0039B95117